MRIINHSLLIMENRALRDKLDKSDSAGDGDCVTLAGVTLKCAFYILLSALSFAIAFFWVQNASAAMLIEGTVYVIVALAVSAIPLVIFSIIMAIFPNSAMVLGPFFSVFAGLALGFIAALFDLVLNGIAFICIVASTTTCFTVIFFDSLLKKKIKNGFLRFFPIFFISIVAIFAVLAIIALTVEKYALLFSEGLLILTVIFIILPTFMASILLMFHMSVIYKLVEYKADKKYEWFLAYSLSQLFIMVYGLVFKMIIVALSSAKVIKR